MPSPRATISSIFTGEQLGHRVFMRHRAGPTRERPLLVGLKRCLYLSFFRSSTVFFQVFHRPGSSVIIVDCRPPWHANLTEWSKVCVAQLRYSASTRDWSLYWADRNGRWHRYNDLPPGRIDQVLIREFRGRKAPTQKE